MLGFCLLVELHWEGFASAVCAADLFTKKKDCDSFIVKAIECTRRKNVIYLTSFYKIQSFADNTTCVLYCTMHLCALASLPVCCNFHLVSYGGRPKYTGTH